ELPLVQSTADTAAPLQEAVAVDSSPALGLYGVRVVLAEDDDAARPWLEVLLKRQRAEVIAVSSAAAALDVLVQSLTSNVPGQDEKTPYTLHPTTNTLSPTPPDLPDIIISDLGMPEEDGYQLIRKVRSLGMDP